VGVRDHLDRITEILEEDGCVVIENVLDQKQVRTLGEELAPHFARTPNCTGDFYGYVTKRLSSLIVKAPTTRLMAIHPLILGVMDEFLLRGCGRYQLNLTQAIRIGPGEPKQILHPDDAMFPFEHPGIEAQINCMWAVDEFTQRNGATHIVPGSHKWPKDRRPQEHEITQGTMPAGSVLIYFASVLHGGGANTSGAPRIGIVLSYCLGWLRQAENQYLAVPIEVARDLPERLQRLLGYFVHQPNLGCLEGRDPIDLLHGENLENSGFREFLPEEARRILADYRSGLAA
jgi:ectoine hydroxylase-related dioxygenase (phytanoyl-CoA dioxygenase family)